jgi:carbamoyl-phosphate synthase large subunit
MNDSIRVAVTGAGGGVGQSVIKALQGTDYGIIALDSDPLATGLYAGALRSYLIPRPTDPAFVDRVLSICRTERCQVLFPGLDTELALLAQNSQRFRDAGVTAVVSSPRVVEVSDNKLLTYRTLTELGIMVPATVDMATWTVSNECPLPYPYVLKKREGGSRSRDVYVIYGRQDLDEILSRKVEVSQFVAQEYVDGDEYTCGSVTLDGQCLGVIVMRRTLRDGDTYKCFAVRNHAVEAAVSELMNALQPFGACNAQLRLKDGKPYVFEINARCSGTTAARAQCGFNEPKMIADYLCRGHKPEFSIAEQTVLRYWNELVVPNDTIDTMRRQGRVACAPGRRL